MHMQSLWRSIVLGVRTHRRRPLLSLVIVLSLVLGIGVNTAVISLVESVFVDPLPVENLDRLVTVYRTQRSESGQYSGKGRFSHPTYRDLRERSRTLDATGIFTWTPVNFSGRGTEPTRATVMFADDGYFRVLGLQPSHGRFFRPDEVDHRTPEQVTVLSHGTWARRFGSDPQVVGETVVINGQSYTVVGIGPRGFRGTKLHVDVDAWVPPPAYLELGPAGEWFPRRDAGIFTLIGRLAPGATAEQASDELMDLSQQLEETYPVLEEGSGAEVDPLVEGVLIPRERDDYVGYMQILSLAAGLVLLVSCLNVAVLLLLRGLERRRELAVRQVLGAERKRLVGELAGENVLLFVVGGLLALPVASWTLELLWKFRPPRFAEGSLDFGLDPNRLLWALGLVGVTTLLFGVLPAWWTARLDLTSQIRGAGEAAGGGAWSFRPGDLLVVGQVALATVTLIGGALFVHNLLESRSIDLGFEPDRLAVATVAPGDQGYDDERVMQFYRALEERVRGLPAVEAASLSANRLLRGSVLQYLVYLEGSQEPARGGGRLGHRTNAVMPGFFGTVGISLLRGRDFGSTDRADSRPVAIINRTMAELAWPDEGAVGKRFHFNSFDEPLVEVIGVVENAKYRYIHEDPQFFIYVPFSQTVPSSATLHVRTTGDPETVLPALRETIAQLDPNLPVADLETMNHFVSDALWQERAAAYFLAGMGLLALVLVIVGIHGVMSFSVRRRARDFGIHLSLGAQRGQVVRRILTQAGRRVAAGLVLGVAGTVFVLRPAASGFLGDVEPGATVLLAALTVILVALAAFAGTLRPALQAVRWRPSVLLQDE